MASPTAYVRVVVVVVAAAVVGAVADGAADAAAEPGPPYDGPPQLDQCGMISQVQSTVIRILNTHYEYGKGIHVLHGIVDGLRADVAALKSKVYELDGRLAVFSSSYAAAAAAAVGPTAAPGEPRPRRPHYLPLPTLDPLTFHSPQAMSRSIQALNWGLRNLTRMMETQDQQYDELERKYLALRRRLKKTTAELMAKAKTTTAAGSGGSGTGSGTGSGGTGDGGARTSEHRYLLEHYMRKQTDINSKLLRRMQALEQRIKLQADSPYAASKHGGCPPNFVRHFTSCYLFVNDTANWVEAEKDCQRKHPKAHLVSIETSEEAEYLVKYRIHNLVHWSSSYIWIGGNDMAHENVWRWVGTGNELGYANWRPGQPDNHNNGQHCIYYRADGADPRWDDWHCYAARLNYVCEINVRA